MDHPAPSSGLFESLLPNNSTDLEFAIEKAVAPAFTDPVNIESIWNPDTCPESLLPWLAWSLSVDQWVDSWDVETKRKVIKSSLWVHRIKGTRQAVEDAVRAIGGDVKIWEWWQDGIPTINTQNGTVKLKPFEFFIEASVTAKNTNVTSAETLNQLKAAIDATKPVRSTYMITLRIDITATPTEYRFARAAVHRRISMETK